MTAPLSTDPIRPGSSRIEDVLQNYKHEDLPDLSGHRSPPTALHTVDGSLTGGISDSLLGDVHVCHAALLAAIARVLGAYNGSTDVLLGLDADHEDLKPIRVVWTAQTTWNDIIELVQSALKDPDHPQLSAEALRRALSLRDEQPPCLALLHTTCDESTPTNVTSPVHFYLDISRTSLSVTISQKYLPPSGSQLLLDQIISLFRHAINSPTSSYASLPSLSQDLISSHEKLSYDDRVSVYMRVPAVRFAADYLTRQTLSQPTGVAVRWYPDISAEKPVSEYYREELTYQEWDRNANRMARWLISQGLQSEDRVAVCMNRNTWFHIALIAVLRAGGCYVPIDPDLPQERQAFIARDSNARFVLTTSDLLSSSLFPNAVFVDSPEQQQAISRESEQELNAASVEGLSYLLYTSGTTGTPKGCLLTHEGLTEAIWSLADVCARVPMDDYSLGNYLSVASVAFDVHLAEILVPMALGIPIMSAPRALLLENLPHYIKELSISHVGIVPSLIEATMGAVQEEQDSGHETSLRYIASGGEKMSDAILDQWANHPTVRLANFYGPSEVTIGCCSRFMNRSTPRANIGRAFANVSAYVVDENIDIVLRGSAGELVVEGPLVGRGYHGRPDLTEKVFIEFPEKGRGRWAYRTGDLVRMMPDATLEIIGRIDTQIKLRGVRIESEGVSSIVRSGALPGLKLDAVTILGKHPTIATEQLVSFVVFDHSVSIAVRKSAVPTLVQPPEGLLDSIRRACDKELANYMRPSHVIPLSWMPLSSNGKVDAKILKRIFEELPVDELLSLLSHGSKTTRGNTGEDAKLNPTEEAVVEAARQCVRLPADRVTPYTNLFECGLDSMGAIRLATALKKMLNKPFSASDILKSPIIRDIASVLDIDKSSEVSSDGSFVSRFAQDWRDEISRAYPSAQVDAILPSFPVQEGVLYRSSEATTLYVQHVLLRCNAQTSIQKLRVAWQETVSRHEILRTVFHFGRELVQVVLHADDCPLQWIENTTQYLDDTEFREHFVSEEASQLASTINENVTSIPPFRISTYAPQSNESRYVVLSIHHALFDGISLPVLLRAVESAYNDAQDLDGCSLTDILNEIDTIDVGQAQEFWKQQFTGFQFQKAPLREPSTRAATTLSVPFRISLSDLQAKAASHGVTLQAVLMYAYGRLLAERISHQDDVVFGVIRAGRMLPVEGVETALCPMISVLPSRIDFRQPDNVLHSIQRAISLMTEFEHVPLGKVQQWVHPGAALFDTLFSVSFKETDTSTLWHMVDSQNPEPDYFLAVEVILDPATDSLSIQAAFTETDVGANLIKSFLEDFEHVSLELPSGKSGLNSPVSSSSPTMISESEGTAVEDDFGPEADVDEDILRRVSAVISEFLLIDASLLREESSLIALGLDSIRSVGLSRAFRAKKIDLSPSDLLRCPTVRALAIFVGRKTSPSTTLDHPLPLIAFTAECQKIRKASDVDELKLSPEDDVQIFPTTALQAGMLSQTIASAGQQYVHVFPLRLHRTTDIPRLQEAWKSAVQSFGILRTSFSFLPDLGQWTQVVHSDLDFKWVNHSYQKGVKEADQFHDLIRSIHVDTLEALRHPPIYLNLLRDEDGLEEDPEALLVLTMHHALYDGLSVAKLLDAVQLFYHDKADKAPVQFTDLLPHILWQEKEGTPFWTPRLTNLRNVPLSSKPQTSQSSASYTATYHLELAADKVYSASRRLGVTPQCLAQLAFVKLLATLTKSFDIVFGHVVSGRSLTGAEDVIGPILNTIPCRVQLQKNLSNEKLLKSIHKNNVDALPWQQASLRSIQRELGLARLWDSVFVYQPYQPPTADLDPLWEFDITEDEDAKIQYPLNLELHQLENSFRVEAACLAEVLDAAELTTALGLFANYLRDIIEDPERKCSDDLPDIFLHSAPIRNDAENKSVAADDVDWKNLSYAKFRDMLCAITGLPQNQMQASTSLAALGIDSITAIQIVAKSRRIGITLLAGDIIQSRTVGDLVQKIKVIDINAVKPQVPITHRPVPSSHFKVSTEVEATGRASAGMAWLIGAWEQSGGARFQHAFAYRLSADVERSRLREAWIELLRRHAILRSTFVSEDGDPQIIAFKPDVLGPMWTEESLDGDDSAIAVLATKMKDMVSNPPSMREPMTKAVLFRSNEHGYLVIRMHHFQYDAWSLQLLLDDLSRIYRGKQPLSSNNLFEFLDAVTTPTSLSLQRDYWTTAFPALREGGILPSIRPSARQTRIVYINREVLPHASELLERARSHAISLQAIFLLCWAQVQSHRTSADDATFGLWLSGRTLAFDDIERLAVPCMNVLPFHVSKVKGCNPLATARRIQEDLRNRTPIIEQTDLSHVDEWIGGGGKPLCNVFVNIIKIAPDIEDEFSPVLEPVQIPHYVPDVVAQRPTERMKIANFIKDDVMVDIVTIPNSNTIAMSIEANSEFMNEKEAQAAVAEWAALVEACLA